MRDLHFPTPIYIFDYKEQSTLICTQPRIPPTELVSQRISREMGVPIHYLNNNNKQLNTQNKIIQFEHGSNKHTSKNNKLLNMKFVTDGLLYQKIIFD